MPGSTKLETREDGAIQGSLGRRLARRRPSATRTTASRPSLDRKRMIQTLVVVLVLVVGDLLPAAEARRPRGRDREARRRRPVWIAVALGFTSLIFGLLRRAVPRRRRRATCCRSTGARPTRSHGGPRRHAGCSRPAARAGSSLTYWALRKAGMERRQSASRMVAFLVLLYVVYLARAGRLRDPAAHRRAGGRARRRADDRPGGDRRAS